jgi:glycolate oxidase FAD binding subunit
MLSALRPERLDDLCQAVRESAAAGASVEVRGGGSKADISAPDRDARVLDTRGFDRVLDYDPAELVLTVGAGASLAAVETLLADSSQMLAFEPLDHGPIFGCPRGRATIGGVVCAAVSGPRRISAGAARDHLLGFEGVSGRGEVFKAGGRVVKNVTGYDLSKVMAGSWGRLAILTTVTLKTAPRPEVVLTLAVRGLDDRQAAATMAAAMGSQAAVAAAAHLPEAAGGALTLLRLEGFAAALPARCAILKRAAPGAGVLDEDAARLAWNAVCDVEPLKASPVLWRISVAPSRSWAVFDALAPLGVKRTYDWAGALLWLGTAEDVDSALVRGAAEAADGQATLVRAPAHMRASTSIRHPQPPALARLSARVKAAFDPHLILDPLRFGA